MRRMPFPARHMYLHIDKYACTCIRGVGGAAVMPTSSVTGMLHLGYSSNASLAGLHGRISRGAECGTQSK